jgi:hypothetical protein
MRMQFLEEEKGCSILSCSVATWESKPTDAVMQFTDVVCVWGGAGRGGEQEACHRSNPAHGDHTPKSRRRRPRTAARPPGPPTSRRHQQHAREKESKWQQAVGRVVTNRWVNRSGVGAGAGGSVVLLGPD